MFEAEPKERNLIDTMKGFPIGSRVFVELWCSVDQQKSWYKSAGRIGGTMMAMPTAGKFDEENSVNIMPDRSIPEGDANGNNHPRLISLLPVSHVLANGNEIHTRYLVRQPHASKSQPSA